MTQNNKPHYVGHRQRLLEKFQKAPNAFSDYELIELLLTFSIPRIDVKPLAKELTFRYKYLIDLLNESPENLAKIKGISTKTAILFNLVAQICKFSAKQETKNKIILQNWDILKNYCLNTLGFKKNEEFHVLFLDTKGELIADECVSSGTIDHATIYPRSIIEFVVQHNAKSIILLHNHPSGETAPSKNDINITTETLKMLKPLNVRLIDHLIVGKNKVESFKDRGFWGADW